MRPGSGLVLHLGMRTTALSLLLPAALVASAGFAGTPAGVVSDGAGLFTAAERAKIEILGGELLDRQGVTVRVVTLAEAGGRNPKAIATGELRGLDPKSVVLLILVSPQVAHLQPGIDHASSFNEQVSATICSVLIAPQLRARAFGAGAMAGLTAIRDRLSRPAAVRATAMPARPPAADSSQVEAKVFDPSPWILGFVLAIFPVYWILNRLFGRKCSRCRARMSKSVEVVNAPTYNTHGLAQTLYSCVACGHTEAEAFSVGPLSR